jgi:hypothetical protein
MFLYFHILVFSYFHIFVFSCFHVLYCCNFHTILFNSLHFHSIDDLEFYFIFGNFNRTPSEEDMDRLSQLKFNPFNINTLNLHLNQYVTCNYHLPNDFSTITDENKNLTILNLNIRSIANKFDTFKHLLNT